MLEPLLGTLLNVGGIVLGTAFGLLRRQPLSMAHQFFFKAILGAAAVFVGLRLTVTGISGSFLQIVKHLVIVVLALMLGKIVGRLLRLQKGSNRLGQLARKKMLAATPGNPDRFSDGFQVCAILFCAAPLGMLGALINGLSGSFAPLAIKAVMDGLAAAGFVAMFGWGVLWSAVPVLIFQGTLALLSARFLLPLLDRHALVDPVNATAGLLIFCVALIIFEVKKIEITDYLPSLFFAPLLAAWMW